MREGQNVNEKKQMSSNGEGKVNVTKVLKGLHTKAKKRKRLQKNECTQTRVYKQTYLLMVFLQEVKFFFQAVQISPQRGDDLLMVSLGLFQSNTVSLHRLTHHQLSLPPSKVQKNDREMQKKKKNLIIFRLLLVGIDKA